MTEPANDRCYQYAKSTDPDVIAVVERNCAGRVEAAKRCQEWAKRFGAEGYFRNTSGGYALTAIILDERPKGAGQWVWNYHRTGFLPGKRNPLREEMESLAFEDEKVPGLYPIVISRDSYFLTSTPFVVDGAAWIMYARVPGDGYGLGPQWHEVKASEAYAAKEAWEEANQP